MPSRRTTVALSVVTVVALAGVGAGACSSDSGSSSSATTEAPSPESTESTVGNVTTPVVLTPDDPSTTVTVGQVVTFDMGEPGDGSYVAVSDDEAVFRVDNDGKDEGTYATNAGGTAVGEGTATVAVSFRGSENGVGTPTEFTITVD